MSGFIELCGPPGVGKTTLAQALTGRSPTGQRRPPQAASTSTLLVDAGYLPLGLRTPGARFGDAALGTRGLARLTRWRSAARLLGPAGSGHTGDAALRTSPARESLSGGTVLALAGLPLPTGSDPRATEQYRARAMEWLERTLELIRYAEELPTDLTAILSEGVVQRAVSLLGATADPADLATLLARLPHPRALVHLIAAPELLRSRASMRRASGSEPMLHAGEDPEAVLRILLDDAQAIGRAAGILGDHDVPVLRVEVDASESDLTRSAAAVLRFIDRVGC